MNVRILRLASLLVALLAVLNPAIAQDAATDTAKALLKQGLDQYKALDFTNAKASLMKVEPSALAPADKKNLEDHLAKIDNAIKQQSQARDAYAKAEAALKQGDLTAAKDGFTKAAASEYLSESERKDANAQMAQVEQKIKAAAVSAKAAPVAAVANAAPAAAAAETAPAATTAANTDLAAEAPAATQDAELAAAVATVPAAAPAATEAVATGPAATSPAGNLSNLQANRADAARKLLEEGKAALDNGKTELAVEKLQRAVVLAPDDAQAKKLLDQARALLAKQNPGSQTVLSRLEQMRLVAKQIAELEFAKALKRSNDILREAKSAADFDAALTAARDAKRQLDDKKELFTAKEYSDRAGEVDSQIAFVNTQKADWEQRRAVAAGGEAERANQRRIAQAEQQRRERIAALATRAKTLTSEMKYDEAIGIYDQILTMDPKNQDAASKKEVLSQIHMLRQEGDAYKALNNQLQENARIMRQEEIPWTEILRHPPDWRELSDRRKDIGASSANETEEDRIVRQKLKTKIPDLDFNATPFEDAITFFRTLSGVNFHVNWAALAIGTVEKSTPVNLKLTDVTVQKALDLVLQDLSTNVKLSYVVQDGVVTISTKDDLAKTPVIQVYDIRDLIFTVQNFSSSNLSFGTGTNGTNGTSGFGTNNNGTTNNNNGVNRDELVNRITNTIKTTVDPTSWAPTGTVGSIEEMNGSLIVTQTLENHEKLADLISKLRETRALQVTVEARFVSVSSGFLNSIGLDLDLFFNTGSGLGGATTIDPFTGAVVPQQGVSGWGPGFPSNPRFTPVGVLTSPGIDPITGRPVPVQGSLTNTWGNMVGVSTPLGNSIGGQVLSPSLSVGGTFLDDIQVDYLIQATQANSTTRTLTAPRLTLFNGQQATVTVGTLQAYVSGLQPVVGAGNVALYQPTIATIMTGSTLTVTATVSADRRYVTLEVLPTVQTLNAITSTPIGGGASIQTPNVTQQSVQTTVTVPDGGTLLLGGQRLSAEVEREGGVPGLSKIPIVQRLFTNRGKVRDEQTLLILVRPKIIIPREEEDKAFPPMK